MKKGIVLLCLITTMLGRFASAQTWNGSVNTDWNTAANWTPAVVPSAASNVVVPGSVVSSNWPSFAADVTINSINMQDGSQLNINGFVLTLTSVGAYNYFTGATLNNSNGATDIIINVSTGGGGYVTYFRSNTVNDAIIFNITGSNPFIEGNAGPSNQYNGNVSFIINDALPVYISHTSPSQYNGNLTITRTVAGVTSMFNAGGNITGNYTFTNNAGGGTGIGNIGIKTSIGGSVTITANNPSPAVFEMYRMVNQTTGGSINVQNTTGFIVQADTLLLNSLSITGYVSGQFGRLWNNDITGNVNIADDASFAGGYNTTIRNNVITGNSIFSNNGVNTFLEGDLAGTGNVYNGDVSFNAAGGPVYISHLGALQCSGNLSITRTAAGFTQAFNAGGTVSGNFAITNYDGGLISLGNIGISTSIGGTVAVSANYNTTPDVFIMFGLVNQTTGGLIDVKNSIGFNVQRDTLKVSSMSITGYRTGEYGRLWNNDIAGQVTIADDASYGGAFNTTIRNNVITGNSIFSNNGVNNFLEGDLAGTGNVYNGDVSFNAAGGPVYISYLDALQCSGNLNINRTVAGFSQAFNAGGTVTGNFAITNNAGGLISLGNIGISTSIGGTVAASVNYNTTPDVFIMLGLVNQTTGGLIDVQNSIGFDVRNDTLKVSSLRITGYRTGAFGRLWNNDITGNVTIADDASFAGGYNTTIRNNIITGNSIFSNNGVNNFLEGDVGGTGNIYNGDVSFNAAGGPVYISYLGALQCSGNLSINRTVAGLTQAFNAGGTVTGNFAITNNTGGLISLGNIGISTSIGGTVTVSANYLTPDVFIMFGLVNQITGGTIDVQNSIGFDVRNDTLKVNSFSITGYRSGAFGRLWNNDITGNVTIADDASFAGGYNTSIRGNIITGNTSFTNNGSNIFSDADVAATGNKYTGNITYTRNGGTITVAAGDFNEITQNLTLNSTGSITLGRIKFTGATNSAIEQLGEQPIIIPQLTLQKSGSATVTLNDSVSVSTKAIFTSGYIIASSFNNLKFLNNATNSGASDASFVVGPVTKVGNDAFTFPIGKNNTYAPISLTAPAVGTDAFRAQYFNTNAHDAGYDSSQYDPALNHISRKEYWLLDRVTGTSTPKVTLAWKTIRSGIVNVLPDLRVARWDGSKWKDEGNGGTTGNNDEGTIQSLNNISSFSPFTLASISINNSLPVNFITFNATLRADRAVSLQWKTGLEFNNARFEVQRSADGRTWLPIGSVMPSLSREYEFIDYAMAAGMNYYRIMQVDRDGNHSFSVVKAIRVSGLTRLVIWPNPVKDNLYVQTPFAKGTVEISDMNGRLAGVSVINNTITIIPVQQLAKGLYVIRVRNDGEVYSEKFMKE